MKNRTLALNLTMAAAGMVMLAYASVPLYRIFCAVTGYGGTTQEAAHAPDKIYDRTINIRFNADHDPALPWEFLPNQKEIRVRVGEEVLVSYRARNLQPASITGRAVYNVVPNKAGPYFAKLECFCFTEQTLAPDQEVNMPISFFIDPALLEDPEMDDIQTITLSYTFFQVKDPAK